MTSLVTGKLLSLQLQDRDVGLKVIDERLLEYFTIRKYLVDRKLDYKVTDD